MTALTISSEELEVVCDALWFVMGNGGLSPEGEELWDRLQPFRHGDCRGPGTLELTPRETAIVGSALNLVESVVGMDARERALAERAGSAGAQA